MHHKMGFSIVVVLYLPGTPNANEEANIIRFPSAFLILTGVGMVLSTITCRLIAHNIIYSMYSLYQDVVAKNNFLTYSTIVRRLISLSKVVLNCSSEPSIIFINF